MRTQIINAIDDDYLRPLKNIHTDTINDSISFIFNFLKTTYGNMTTGQLKSKEAEVDDMLYDPSTTVDSVFNKIDDFQDLCVLTTNAKIDTQLVNTAYLICQKTGLFMDSLKRWNQKASVDKTYQNLKIYMRKEYLDPQEEGGLTINNSSLSQANLVQELKEHQYKLANNMKEQLTDNFVKTLQSMHMMVQDENQNPMFRTPEQQNRRINRC